MKQIAIVWQQGPVAGDIEVADGRAVAVGSDTGTQFNLAGTGEVRLEVTVDDEKVGYGPHPTMVSVNTKKNPFTFLLRDINASYPIWIPDYKVTVTEATDKRSYAEISASIRQLKAKSALQQIASAPETSYERIANSARKMQVPTWLGLSRDIRFFEFDVNREIWRFEFRARYHWESVKITEPEEQRMEHAFYFGRGTGCVENLKERRLEDGYLPILHARSEDEAITYNLTTFASLERSPLTAVHLRGTHYRVAYGYAAGRMFTPETEAEFNRLLPQELEREEEVVLWGQVKAKNTSQAPRYAWFQAPYQIDNKKNPFPRGAKEFDGKKGFRPLCDGKTITCVAKLNSEPFPQPEVAYLLQPGEEVTMEFCIPHRPVGIERAEALAAQSFAARHAECRKFWRAKLAYSADLKLPERRIEEMMQAGKLHLDLVAYGLEPDGPVAPTIGVYAPIGSESSPIIQYFDSVGWHKLAERAIEFFLVNQHDNGFIQNFGGYMLETGPAMWTAGEHYRYTRDKEWLARVKPKLIKACDFMLDWRNRNKDEALRGRGYGMMEGKVADPEDPFHSFMLNGYGYLGIARIAEALADIDPLESKRLAAEAQAFKADIVAELKANIAKSPVVPLGDGTWCPSAGPWAEARGPVSLMTDGESWWTHASFVARDSLLGPLYLLLQEVVEVNTPEADWLVNFSADLFHQRNVAFSQPYYSEHALANLRRGEVKAFLAAFYNGFTGLADRETYTFWEHHSHASVHKTHEEGWFLMQCRWMLYLERGDTLQILPGIPRAWLEDGKEINIKNAASYFGPISFRIVSELKNGRIRAIIDCDTDRKPVNIEIRLPHPKALPAKNATGGVYDPATETVKVENFTGHADVMLDFS
jgi:hypothetical protein